MIARLQMQVPFHMAVAKTAMFTVFGYEWEGYFVRVFPPSYTEERAATDPDDLIVNGEHAELAKVLHIEFQKDQFDRRQGAEIDPPQAVIEHAIQSFLWRFRHVSRGFNIRPPTFRQGGWRLEYLNDDGTPLESAEGLVKVRGGIPFFSVSFTALTPEIWTSVHQLPPEYEPPPWDVLLLDAQSELPKVGTSIVLAATALEVFIALVLDQLASKNKVTPEIWAWINERRQ